jgi:hypothetical protein
MSRSLVALDTDQIKRYVFATGKLKEIRGASALLDQLNREKMIELVKAVDGDQVYANGGSGLFEVDTEKAEPVIQAIKTTYRKKTGTASITGVTVVLPSERSEDVKPQLNLLRYCLRAQKDRRDKPVLPLTHPLLYACDSCGVEYATDTDRGERLCCACQIKRCENEKVQNEIERWTTEGAQPDPDSPRLWERLIARLKAQDYPVAGYERPGDFGTLGHLSSPRGYMGLIYADGDGMGHEIEQITDLETLRRFANAVDSSVYQAVQEAVVECLWPEGSERVWPFDVLLLGGDDLVMVTRAQSAIQVALHVIERFPDLTRERWGKPLNLSASVVLTHTNFPIGPLLELAESGLKFAKRHADKRRLGGQLVRGGLLNFSVVSSANHLDFGQYFTQTLKEIEGSTTIYRTQRPYTAPEMHALLNKIQEMRSLNVPRTKLEQLRTAVFKSRHQATIDAMMTVLRLSNSTQRQALLELVGTTRERQVYLPWIQQDEDWTTPVLDVVELLDFVR